jgi:lysophospholipase L1-like esterase
MNTATEVVEGIRAICQRIRSKVPRAEIILMAVMPREQSPDHPRRKLIIEINRQLAVFAKESKITLIDIGPNLLTPDGILSREIAKDFCHPTEKGYQIWADELRPFLNNIYPF